MEDVIEELIGEEIYDESDIQRRMSTAAVATRAGFHRQLSTIGDEGVSKTKWGSSRMFQRLMSVPNVRHMCPLMVSSHDATFNSLSLCFKPVMLSMLYGYSWQAMHTYSSNARRQDYQTLGDFNGDFNQGTSQVPLLFNVGDDDDVSLHCTLI